MSESVVGAVFAAAERAGDGRQESVGALFEELVRADGVVRPSTARVVLGAVTGRPELVVRLDQHVRRWDCEAPPGSGLVATALRMSAGNGWVREQAVSAVSRQMCPEVMPLLVLRCQDWVPQVRRGARVAVAVALSEWPAEMLAAALPVALRIGGRIGGDFAVAQVLASLTMLPVDLRTELAGAGDRRQRRFVLDVGLAQGWHRTDELVWIAETDPDRANRERAAETACREAVWTRRPAAPRRLAGNRSGAIRAVALTGLVRGGLDTEAAAYLDDRSPLVRATAREAARRVGVDPPAHYRAACAGTDPAPGAVAGLAEVGSAADAPLLLALLAHPAHGVRLAAVKGLRALNRVVVDELSPLLDDASPKVVRAAMVALLPVADRVPEPLAWRLLGDERQYRRVAGYRLLVARGTDTLLRAALLVAVDGTRLGGQAVADLTRLGREAGGRWGRVRRPELVADAERLEELLGLARRAEGALGPETTRMLTDWLGSLTG